MRGRQLLVTSHRPAHRAVHTCILSTPEKEEYRRRGAVDLAQRVKALAAKPDGWGSKEPHGERKDLLQVEL